MKKAKTASKPATKSSAAQKTGKKAHRATATASCSKGKQNAKTVKKTASPEPKGIQAPKGFTGPIMELRDVRAFFEHIVGVDGVNFHPDTAFADYSGPDGKPVYKLADAERLDRLMEKAFEVCAALGADIYEIGSEVLKKRTQKADPATAAAPEPQKQPNGKAPSETKNQKRDGKSSKPSISARLRELFDKHGGVDGVTLEMAVEVAQRIKPGCAFRADKSGKAQLAWHKAQWRKQRK